ncbi:MAG: glycosyltransferase [Candidatus Auribacterota bacterium]
MPAVSVVIPTYNSGKYLLQTLQSVLNQTYKDFEILVVDDGSTDNTQQIIQSVIRQHPDKIRYMYQENSGVGAARNNGIRHARGQYIAFLDADDVWLPQKLQVQIDFIQRNSEYDFVFSDVIAMDENGHNGKRMMQFKKPRSGYIFYDLLEENFISLPTSFVKRDCIEKVGYFCEDRIIMSAEDHHFWLKLALCSKGGYIDQPLACYRIRSDSISSKKVDHRKICLEAIGKISEEYPDAYESGKKHFKRRRATLYYEIGYICYRRNRFKEAFHYIVSSLNEDYCFKPSYKLFLVLLLIPKSILRYRNTRIPDEEKCLLELAESSS